MGMIDVIQVKRSSRSGVRDKGAIKNILFLADVFLRSGPGKHMDMSDIAGVGNGRQNGFSDHSVTLGIIDKRQWRRVRDIQLKR